MDRTSDFGSDSEGSNPSAVTRTDETFFLMFCPSFFVCKLLLMRKNTIDSAFAS